MICIRPKKCVVQHIDLTSCPLVPCLIISILRAISYTNLAKDLCFMYFFNFHPFLDHFDGMTYKIVMDTLLF